MLNITTAAVTQVLTYGDSVARNITLLAVLSIAYLYCIYSHMSRLPYYGRRANRLIAGLMCAVYAVIECRLAVEFVEIPCVILAHLGAATLGFMLGYAITSKLTSPQPPSHDQVFVTASL